MNTTEHLNQFKHEIKHKTTIIKPKNVLSQCLGNCWARRQFDTTKWIISLHLQFKTFIWYLIELLML